MVTFGIAILIALLAAFALRGLAWMKLSILDVHDKYLTKFFELADELADRDLPPYRLAKLSHFANTVRSRKMQIIVFQAFKELEKEEKTQLPSRVSNEPAEHDLSLEDRKLWNRMYFHWLAAVSAQGSLVGFGGLAQLLKYFDPDDIPPPKMVRVFEAAHAY